jgi:hypothetical protein
LIHPSRSVRGERGADGLGSGRPTSKPNREPGERQAAIRNLVTGMFRRAGFANIVDSCRYYGRDDARIPVLYGYT